MDQEQQLAVVGKRIRALRTASGKSQEHFAIEAGLDRAYYGAIERGTKNVGMLILIKIAAALDVEVGELFPPISDLASSTRQDPGHRS